MHLKQPLSGAVTNQPLLRCEKELNVKQAQALLALGVGLIVIVATAYAIIREEERGAKRKPKLRIVKN